MESACWWEDGTLHYTPIIVKECGNCGNKQNTVQLWRGLQQLSSQYLYIYIHIHTANLSNTFYWGGFPKHCTTLPQDTAINIFLSIWRWLKRAGTFRASWIQTIQKYTSLWTSIRRVTYDGWKTMQQAEKRWINQAASCSIGTLECLTAVTQAYQQTSHLKSNLRFNYQGKSRCSAISPTAT